MPKCFFQNSPTVKPVSSKMDPLARLLFLFLLPLCSSASEKDDGTRKSYIVYMGGSTGSHENYQVHLELLSSLVTSDKKQSVIINNIYHHTFKGFSAMLTEKEASLLSDNGEIVSVFPDPKLELHTTRSWDFLEEEAASGHFFQSSHHRHLPTHDVIIGMIDTGIWPESPSFNDKGIVEIPYRWKGVCMEGPDFNKSHCNRKLIGARYYNIQGQGSLLGQNGTNYAPDGISISSSRSSPRDHDGHGTHTASTAAGSLVPNASYHGLAKGLARGGSPTSRLAVYKACTLDTCSGSTILKAIDDAVKDGVDVISISLGMSLLLQPDFLNDPIAIGAFHAHEKGVLVVCSAGNYGPEPYSLVNTAPWILTVSASNIDRDFESTVVLGNHLQFRGSAITFSNLTRSTRYPLAFAGDVAAEFTPATEASNCYPGTLDPTKVAGKIIVCVDTFPSISRRIKKLVAEDAGAKGVIYITSGSEKGVPFDSGAFPFAQLTQEVGLSQILNYINNTKKPTATILPTSVVPKFRPAPAVADFSSRGPGQVTENILKPDLMAPGVAVLAAVTPTTDSGYDAVGKKPPNFGIKSGTSMACPHVTGAAAFIKSVYPRWTPSMIKSALMTTATASNNLGRALTNSSGNFANPHETGTGELSPTEALNPGLVFATTTEDYLKLLCYAGNTQKSIRAMAIRAFKCPNISKETLISNINYPTISIGKLKSNHTRKITRQVTNVGTANSTYTVSVQAPRDLIVNVEPKKLVFSKGSTKASFSVSFNGTQSLGKGYKFGSLTWSDGKHQVRVVFALNIV